MNYPNYEDLPEEIIKTLNEAGSRASGIDLYLNEMKCFLQSAKEKARHVRGSEEKKSYIKKRVEEVAKQIESFFYSKKVQRELSQLEEFLEEGLDPFSAEKEFLEISDLIKKYALNTLYTRAERFKHQLYEKQVKALNTLTNNEFENFLRKYFNGSSPVLKQKIFEHAILNRLNKKRSEKAIELARNFHMSVLLKKVNDAASKGNEQSLEENIQKALELTGYLLNEESLDDSSLFAIAEKLRELRLKTYFTAGIRKAQSIAKKRLKAGLSKIAPKEDLKSIASEVKKKFESSHSPFNAEHYISILRGSIADALLEELAGYAQNGDPDEEFYITQRCLEEFIQQHSLPKEKANHAKMLELEAWKNKGNRYINQMLSSGIDLIAEVEHCAAKMSECLEALGKKDRISPPSDVYKLGIEITLQELSRTIESGKRFVRCISYQDAKEELVPIFETLLDKIKRYASKAQLNDEEQTKLESLIKKAKEQFQIEYLWQAAERLASRRNPLYEKFALAYKEFSIKHSKDLEETEDTIAEDLEELNKMHTN